MKIFSNRRSVEIKVKKVSEIGKFIGLMFKSKNTEILLFEFEGKLSIHSFFVFFDFLAVWLDEKNRIIELNVVKPFTPSVKSPKLAKKLIEISFNDENKNLIKNLVGKERFK
mgnify:CR=1 FL=1